MPPKRKKYKIVKVSLGYEPEFKVPHFEPVSRLYMELLENPEKIKQELLDSREEFESRFSGGQNIMPSLEQVKDVKKQITMETDREMQEENGGSSLLLGSPRKLEPLPVPSEVPQASRPSSPKPENKFLSTYKKSTAYSPRDASPIAEPKDSDEAYTSGMFGKTVQPRNHTSYPSKNTFIIGDDEEHLSDYVSNKRPPQIEKPVSYSSSQSNNLERMMKGDFSDDDHHSHMPSSSVTQENKPLVSNTQQRMIPSSEEATAAVGTAAVVVATQRVIPSLEEIAKNQVPRPNGPGSSSGGKVDGSSGGIANMSYVGSDKDLTRKRDLLFKFKYLKKHYTDGNIPDVNEFMDLRELEREYDSVTRQLRMDERIENYKKFLIIGFFGLEFVLKTFLKFPDIEGFAKQQLVGINQYEKILVEIGEKYQVTPNSQWPPELRLLGIIFMNAAVFLGTKMLTKGASSGISNILSSAFGGSSAAPSAPSRPRPTEEPAKRKMRGPDIDIEDLDSKKFN